MRITAKRIENWAGQSGAPAELPRLIRRLAHATTSLQSAAMPAGEAVHGLGGFENAFAVANAVDAGLAPGSVVLITHRLRLLLTSIPKRTFSRQSRTKRSSVRPVSRLSTCSTSPSASAVGWPTPDGVPSVMLAGHVPIHLAPTYPAGKLRRRAGRESGQKSRE
jgi:hypothetical protein